MEPDVDGGARTSAAAPVRALAGPVYRMKLSGGAEKRA